MQNINQISSLVNSYIEDIQFPANPAGLYEPIKYILSLGGKRIRPVLMLMAYNLYHEDIESIMNSAIALETYHNFTLLHDDLMDKSDLRRGNPTVHKKWNDNTAILSGDTMLILAYKMFSYMNVSRETMASFVTATLQVCEGQQYDMEFETRNDVTEDEYMEMIRLKTSVLLANALKIGAQLAGASDSDCKNLYDFGEKMGLAFQLQDDLLDVYGDPKVFRKKLGGDILCNKKTFLLINALEKSSPEQRTELERWLNATEFDPDEKIQAVTAIYNNIGIADICQQRIEELFSQSIESLDKVNVPTAKKMHLRDFAYKLMGRKY